MKSKKNNKAQSGVFKGQLAVIGAGYVGLVSAACFADLGFRVLLVERSKNRVERLKRGIMPFHEPGLEQLVVKNINRKRLNFTTDIKKATENATIIIVAVGTPTLPNGNVDMKDYWAVIEEIAKHAKRYHVIVNKSTVPIGTAKKAITHLVKFHRRELFDLVSFPEFLREGSAIEDFMHPDRLVIGSSSRSAERLMRALLRPLSARKLFVGLETAEMTKYASNAFLATKISFINEIANVCETIGADVDMVAEGMGLDKRIGKHFLKAGIGYGGSCFPKDVKALKHIAGSRKYKFQLLKAVIEVNGKQRDRVVQKLQKYLGSLRGKTITVLGLAFKNNTDDVRESAAIDIIKRLLKKGATVIAHDPIAEDNARKVLEKDGQLVYCDSAEQAVIDADAVVIATEWKEFKSADWRKMKESVRRPLIIDGRNILDKAAMQKLGFEYYAIGK